MLLVPRILSAAHVVTVLTPVVVIFLVICLVVGRGQVGPHIFVVGINGYVSLTLIIRTPAAVVFFLTAYS